MIITWTLSKMKFFNKFKKSKINFNKFKVKVKDKVKVKSLHLLHVKRIKNILLIPTCLRDMLPRQNNFYSNIIRFKQLYHIHVKVWHYWNTMNCKAKKIEIYQKVYQKYLNLIWMRRRITDFKDFKKSNHQIFI